MYLLEIFNLFKIFSKLLQSLFKWSEHRVLRVDPKIRSSQQNQEHNQVYATYNGFLIYTKRIVLQSFTLKKDWQGMVCFIDHDNCSAPQPSLTLTKSRDVVKCLGYNKRLPTPRIYPNFKIFVLKFCQTRRCQELKGFDTGFLKVDRSTNFWLCLSKV